jgi:hypothetical protein
MFTGECTHTVLCNNSNNSNNNNNNSSNKAKPIVTIHTLDIFPSFNDRICYKRFEFEIT